MAVVEYDLELVGIPGTEEEFIADVEEEWCDMMRCDVLRHLYYLWMMIYCVETIWMDMIAVLMLMAMMMLIYDDDDVIVDDDDNASDDDVDL